MRMSQKMTDAELLATEDGHHCPNCGRACDCPHHKYDEERDEWEGCGHCM